ncbi:delta-12-fatty acid desaturase [Chytridium lagenaria]|nr:delta-12-fatty acid desaturase [Chytridium lagenaria]
MAVATSTDLRHRKPTVNPPNPSSIHAAKWQPPPFTIKELRDCIPADCFVRDTFKSFTYVFHDLFLAALLFYAATFIDTLPVDGWVKWMVVWPIYWFCQGVVCTGLWVIAHECGHQAFSDSSFINNTVGYIIHSALLVPYFSWKISHSKHHKGNASMTRDQVFVPRHRSALGLPPKEVQEHGVMGHAPVVELLEIVRMLLVGWPAYIIANVSGQKYPVYTSHFHTTSPIFEPKHATQVILSDMGLLITLSLLSYAASIYGLLAVVKYYVVPYLWVNMWLVMITFLQHTDVRVPHFKEGEWDFVKGALSTVDRDFGVLNYFHHHIADTHVAHHLFSTMPHYNAERATEALKKKLGNYYMRDETNIWVALYKSYTSCKFVEDEGAVLWYKR